MILPPPGFAQPIPDSSDEIIVSSEDDEELFGICTVCQHAWFYHSDRCHGPVLDEQTHDHVRDACKCLEPCPPCGALLHDPHFPHQIACSYPLGHDEPHQWMVEDYTKWPRTERQKP